LSESLHLKLEKNENLICRSKEDVVKPQEPVNIETLNESLVLGTFPHCLTRRIFGTLLIQSKYVIDGVGIWIFE